MSAKAHVIDYPKGKMGMPEVVIGGQTGKGNIGNALKAGLVGFFVVFGASWLSEKVNTRLAAIFWSLPFTLVPVILFSKTRSRATSLMTNAIGSTMILLIWVVACWYFFKQFIQK